MQHRGLLLFFVALVSVAHAAVNSLPAIASSGFVTENVQGRFIHMIGGWDGKDVSKAHLLIDVTSLDITSTNDLQNARAGHTAIRTGFSSSTIVGFVPKGEEKQVDGANIFEFNGPVGADFALDSHSAIQYGNILYVFGGRDQDGQTRSELWAYDIDARTWSLVRDFNPVPARNSHTAVVSGSSMFVFGGASFNATSNSWSYFDDVWEFSFQYNVWVQCYSPSLRPSPRSGHAAWVQGSVMYVFGGQNGDNFYNDMWAFNLVTKTWSVVNQGPVVPGARSLMHVAPFNFGGENPLVYVTGGKFQNEREPTKVWTPAIHLTYIPNPAEYFGDVWSWNGVRWSRLGCLLNVTNQTACQSDHRPKCENGCVQGYCIRDNVCVCKGGWSGVNCSENVCDDHRGYSAELIDRIYIGDMLVKVGHSLRALKAKIEYIQSRLPPFDELTSCQKYEPISPIVMQSTSRQGVEFYGNLTFTFQPTMEEFAKCLLGIEYTTTTSSTTTGPSHPALP